MFVVDVADEEMRDCSRSVLNYGREVPEPDTFAIVIQIQLAQLQSGSIRPAGATGCPLPSVRSPEDVRGQMLEWERHPVWLRQ